MKKENNCQASDPGLAVWIRIIRHNLFSTMSSFVLTLTAKKYLLFLKTLSTEFLESENMWSAQMYALFIQIIIILMVFWRKILRACSTAILC